MIDMNEARKLISETFQDFLIKEFTLLGIGKASTVYLANGETIFKIPLQSEGEMARWQRNEAVVLRYLEGKLDIEIPKILCTATSSDGRLIIGETFLSGTPLSYELYDTYDKETQAEILRQLGKIVRQLHEVGDELPCQIEGDEETLEEIIAEFKQRFSAETQSVFRPEEIDEIKEIVEQYKKISVQYPVKPVLCHGDLHFYNLMFDERSKQITGLLDFGCVGYSEPARDWHYYFERKHVLEGYGDNGDKYFLERQKFHALSWLLNNLGEEIQEKQKPYKSLKFIRDYILAERA